MTLDMEMAKGLYTGEKCALSSYCLGLPALSSSSSATDGGFVSADCCLSDGCSGLAVRSAAAASPGVGGLILGAAPDEWRVWSLARLESVGLNKLISTRARRRWRQRRREGETARDGDDGLLLAEKTVSVVDKKLSRSEEEI